MKVIRSDKNISYVRCVCAPFQWTKKKSQIIPSSVPHSVQATKESFNSNSGLQIEAANRFG